MKLRTPKSIASRPYFVWRILPFLREKKLQAAILLEIMDYPPKSAKRLHLVDELKRLKRIKYAERESVGIYTDGSSSERN